MFPAVRFMRNDIVSAEALVLAILLFFLSTRLSANFRMHRSTNNKTGPADSEPISTVRQDGRFLYRMLVFAFPTALYSVLR